MTRVHGFAPIAAAEADATVLILGSMPGQASLTAGQYYAHPQNAFWRILAELLGFDAGSAYATRVAALQAAQIALWDVLHSCARVGSLDAGIERATVVANDFPAFFRQHPGITRVFFNGATAEACFRRHALPSIDTPNIRYARLPSTSPTHATISYAEKLAAWRAAIRPASADF